MCGRYSLHQKVVFDEISEVAITWDGKPRFNISPGQTAPLIRMGESGPEQAELRWGLIPGWAKDAKIAYQCINARSETITTKPAFRSAFRKRRCVVLADGFYEWQKVGAGKQPWRFVRLDEKPFVFAGLWESWTPPGEDVALETFTIITTAPNAVTASVHDRMPVILPDRAAVAAWLDPHTNPESLQVLLKPAPDDFLRGHPVSTLVSSPRNEGPDLARPLPDELRRVPKDLLDL